MISSVVLFRYGKPVEITEEFIRDHIHQDVINIYTGDEFVDVTKDQLIADFVMDRPKRGLLEGIAVPSNASPEHFPIPTVQILLRRNSDKFCTSLPMIRCFVKITILELHNQILSHHYYS